MEPKSAGHEGMAGMGSGARKAGEGPGGGSGEGDRGREGHRKPNDGCKHSVREFHGLILVERFGCATAKRHALPVQGVSPSTIARANARATLRWIRLAEGVVAARKTNQVVYRN